MLIEIDIPDGIYRGGTEYSSKGRWFDCNLLRFRDGVKSPVGGWRPRSPNAVTGIARALHTWNDTTLRGWIGIGTHSGLFAQSRGGTVIDLTPFGFTPGRPNAIQGGGWGTGTWGTGTWGTRRKDVKGILPANTWSLDNWGENLVGIFDSGTHPYEWVPDSSNTGLVATGTAQAGTSNSLTMAAGASITDDAYNGYYLVITGGTGELGESRMVYSYNGASKVAGVLQPWSVTPDNTTTYEIRLSGAIANSPSGTGLVVTDERHLMVIGAVFDDTAIGGGPLRVAWSDKEDNANWDVSSTTSEAGYLDLASNSELMAVVKVRGGVLVLSRTDAFFGTYRGTAFAYGFERVGSNCGVVGRKAVCVVNGVAYWRGVNGFYSFNGFVQPLQCDVWEFFKESANPTQASKFWAVGNSTNDEVWWFDCDTNTNEINRYFYANIKDGHWSNGRLARTAGGDIGAFRDPLMVSVDGLVYEHEVGGLYDGDTPYLESGPLEVGEGERTVTVRRYIPDERTTGEVDVSFIGRMWPNLPETTKGPIAAASPAGVQFHARQVKVRYSAAENIDFRIGKYRFDIVERGKR